MTKSTTHEIVVQGLKGMALSTLSLERSDEDGSWSLDEAIPRSLAQQLCARLARHNVEASWAPDNDDPELAWVYVTIA